VLLSWHRGRDCTTWPPVIWWSATGDGVRQPSPACKAFPFREMGGCGVRCERSENCLNGDDGNGRPRIVGVGCGRPEGSGKQLALLKLVGVEAC